MPTSPGDEAPPPTEAKGGIGGLAGVFRGLTGSKLVKSPPPQPTTSSFPTVSHIIPPGEHEAAAVDAHRLPDNQMDAFRKLKNGTTNERIAAANSLRFAVADYPLTPVSPSSSRRRVSDRQLTSMNRFWRSGKQAKI
jgi:hypothetical protein